MTPERFKELFPEFRNTPVATVQSRIAWAEVRTPEDVWGEKREQGIAFLVAHFLTELPEGAPMRKGEAPGESSYLRERKRLNKIVSSGFRVAGIE